ncbi:MAG TPA: phosphotransferase [Acidobacteriota bacterium]|nr:phosphotransferase [Acidobacteriota bacterium]HYM13526.1 phosphotransferase [Bryobacterales bacterium]
MAELNLEKVERYLRSLLGEPVTVLGLAPLGHPPEDKPIKGYGYGTPIRVDYQAAGRERRSAVLHTLSPGPFGHEHMADRAQILLWEYGAFNRLPRHVRSLDVSGFQADGNLISLGQVEEVCLLTEYAEGQGYFLDLERLRDAGTLTEIDLARADALCDYLVEIHRMPGSDAGLYTRRIRELVGHGECIMGLTDSYTPHPLVTPRLLEKIEHQCVSWRWRLKGLTHRLRQIHGDFHPWNILFRSGVDFRLLDRSRGEYGDPADDVTCLTLNYLFFSLQRSERLEGCLETLFLRFWERYLEKSGDREMLRVVAPFFAFRGLVMASPLWYPTLSDTIRHRLLVFILAVLEKETFDPTQVNRYCGA